MGSTGAILVDPQARQQAVDDGHSRVIIGLKQGASLSALAALETTHQSDIRIHHRYESVAGCSAQLTQRGIDALAGHPEVAWIAADLRGRGALDLSIPRIRADRVHKRFVTGRDVVVAIIDSGIEADHPDIRGAVIHEECFCTSTCGNGSILCHPDCCPDGSARASGPGSAAPGHGHGTGIAGILLSRGNIASVGVAPEARVVSIRVLDDNNSGLVSDWLAALDWIAAHRRDVRVVNMSLASFLTFHGNCADCDNQDPTSACMLNRMFAQVVATLRRRGTIVVAAAGNQSALDALGTPACVEGVLAVGATNPDDTLLALSNSGSELDLLAPGVDIITSGLGGQRNLSCSIIDGMEICGGTSIAAPHVSGAAALLLSARPALSAEQIENALIDNGKEITDTRTGRTHPQLDALAALREITRTRTIEPGGGSGHSDCLLGWNFFPPDIVRRRATPIAACHDGDPVCDGDDAVGQCTFQLSLCFNVRDPLLPFCATGEPIVGVDVSASPPETVEERNATAISTALPPFPLSGADVCTRLIPLTVPRAKGESVSSLRVSARTDTRNDTDNFILRCLAPVTSQRR